MQIQIKDRYTGSTIHEGDYVSILEALSAAIKIGANLCGADLSGANLCGADLSGVDLCGANLCGADLSGADLSGANLCGADLSGVDLRSANLYDADLSGVDLCGAKNADQAIAYTRILPEGDLIGYKKCRGDVIIKLKIPSEAKRSHAFGRKCRAEYVEVVEVFGAEEAVSQFDGVTKYRAGETVRPHEWSEDWQNECAGGIHFFITRLEAENY